MSDPRPAVAYLRVSSRAQDYATQRAAIERAAEARGHAIVRWYAEKRSARTIGRDELDRLRSDARAGLVRTLFVFRLDRLTRSGIRDTFEIIDELRRHGVELLTVADGFALDGPAAEVVLAVMSWASKMELQARAERIAAARERLAAEGRPWGRPRRLDAAAVARACSMQAEGRSVRAIAVAMKIPKSTVARALAASQNPPVGSGAVSIENQVAEPSTK